MSISLIMNDRHIDIHNALEERDGEKLYRLAKLEAQEGNEEVADDLYKTVRKWNREDWAYDEANDN